MFRHLQKVSVEVWNILVERVITNEMSISLQYQQGVILMVVKSASYHEVQSTNTNDRAAWNLGLWGTGGLEYPGGWKPPSDCGGTGGLESPMETLIPVRHLPPQNYKYLKKKKKVRSLSSWHKKGTQQRPL